MPRPGLPGLYNVKIPTRLINVPIGGRGNSTEGEMPRMDRNTIEEIKAHLMQTNDQFRAMVEQHHQYDMQVSELESKHALSPAEEVEEHRLKKLKLHLKDQIEQAISEYRLQPA